MTNEWGPQISQMSEWNLCANEFEPGLFRRFIELKKVCEFWVRGLGKETAVQVHCGKDLRSTYQVNKLETDLLRQAADTENEKGTLKFSTL